MMSLSSSSRSDLRNQHGFGLIEVMFAMVILAFAILGVLGTFHWSEHGLRAGALGSRAQTLAQSRVESKRVGSWEQLLLDDLDGDGLSEISMRDDGQPPDVHAGDGLYTASARQSGIHLLWTVRPQPAGPLWMAGTVLIEVRASYSPGPGQLREVRLGLIRGNPVYVGPGS
jgi:prepilin-type N-terminal cleavage/methylation domain-containing protein